MFSKIASYLNQKKILLCFILLFILLLWLYCPVFFYPPRSDHWPALYNFYRIETLGGSNKWIYLITYDPLINATFRPLSFLLLYFEYCIFGSNFIYMNIINFILYFISILLLYRLALYFCDDKMLIIAFLAVFSFLFSHFDIVSWSFHYHIILSFCLFLSGFILYINYLRYNRVFFLIVTAFLFLIGMLLYEVYFLWPLAILILAYIGLLDKRFLHSPGIRFSYEENEKPLGGRSCITDIKGFNVDAVSFEYNRENNLWNFVKKFKLSIIVLVCIYALYSYFFSLNSILRRFYYGEGVSLWFLISWKSIMKDFFTVLANILYVNVLVNINPNMAYPLYIDDNLNMGGLIMNRLPFIDKILFLAGIMTFSILLYMVTRLVLKKRFYMVRVISFFMFLLCSELFVLFHFKSLVNTGVYNFTQFRFQYVPNAIIILLVIFLFYIFIQSAKVKKICYIILFIIAVLNIQAAKKGITLLNEQLTPACKIIKNIRNAIQIGKVNGEYKLFVDDSIVQRFPALCWNKEMGKRCMRGTYQWIFFKKEVQYFSTFQEATWVINEITLEVIKK